MTTDASAAVPVPPRSAGARLREWLTAYPRAVWGIAAVVVLISLFQLGGIAPALVNLAIVLLVGFFLAAARIYPGGRAVFWFAAALPFLPPIAQFAGDLLALRHQTAWLQDQEVPIGGAPTGLLVRADYERPIPECFELIKAGYSPVFCEGPVDYFTEYEEAMVQYVAVDCRVDPKPLDYRGTCFREEKAVRPLSVGLPSVRKDPRQYWSRSRLPDTLAIPGKETLGPAWRGLGYDISSGYLGIARWEAFKPSVTLPIPFVADQRVERFGLRYAADRSTALGWVRYEREEERPLGSLYEFVAKALPRDQPTAWDKAFAVRRGNTPPQAPTEPAPPAPVQ